MSWARGQSSWRSESPPAFWAATRLAAWPGAISRTYSCPASCPFWARPWSLEEQRWWPRWCPQRAPRPWTCCRRSNRSRVHASLGAVPARARLTRGIDPQRPLSFRAGVLGPDEIVEARARHRICGIEGREIGAVVGLDAQRPVHEIAREPGTQGIVDHCLSARVERRSPADGAAGAQRQGPHLARRRPDEVVRVVAVGVLP